MATQYDTQIQQLYVAYFNRPADASGIAHWANYLATGGTIAQISAAFSQSLEYQVEYSQSTNAGVVTAIYQNLFGRAPEASGLAFWVQALNNRDITVANMVTTIASAAQGTDKVAYDSKVVVAVAFTNALDLPAEQAGYAGTAANDAAKELLATIKTAAQATAAIVPATLDASVAAVIKAGTPFTLESGLAALGAADEAIADFYDSVELDVNGDGEIDGDDVVDFTAITANLTAANDALELNIDDVRFDTETNAGIRAAMIAAQVEINATELETAEGDLTDANEAVAAVRGLNNAIASLTSATEAAEEAADAELDANANLASAFSSLQVRNAAAQFQATGTGDARIITALVDADGSGPGAAARVTIASIVDGEWEIANGFEAGDYTGLAAVITSGNAVLAAEANTEEAGEAALFAQLEVETRDITATGLAALNAITFANIDEADTPTVANIRDELSALRSAGVQADIDDFLVEVNAFLTANDTVLADEVSAQQDAVEAAQTAIDDLQEAIDNLAAAQALVEERDTLLETRAAAIADFEANDYNEPMPVSGSHFGTTGSDIFLAGEADGTITSFGRSGDDVLYIGSGFTLNRGALSTGNNAALEVFFVQQGNNTIVTIETETFGSNSADAEIKIVLTGVDAADLTFENGIISL